MKKLIRRADAAGMRVRSSGNTKDEFRTTISVGVILDRFGFPKAHRIRKRRDFLKLKRCGKAIHAHNFIVVLGDGQQPATRIGITVTKRVGNAVTRNRIKRIVRDYFRLNKQTLPGTLDINVIAKDRAAQRHPSELRSDLNHLFADVSRRYHH